MTDLFPAETVSQNLRGGVAGAQIGINQQMGRAVLGVELSGSWSNISGNSDCVTFNPNGNPQTSTCDIKQVWSAQLLARFGYVPGDGRFFPYLFGGIALSQLNTSLQMTGPTPPLGSFTSTATAAWGSNKLHQGGVMGVGLQYAFSPSLSVGLEYMLAIYDIQDHGSRTTVTFNINGLQTSSLQNISTPMNLTTSTARVVMNYRFE
jgi:opacity protein-like surface antigen